jgi:3'-phosphoadenosine 5'-phosphosulfate sulfotransferase (PAPS reductase)/FAD synthetase
MPASNFDSLVNQGKLLPLDQYDQIIVSYSGGKDSLAVLLMAMEIGAAKDRIELWHQHVDGEPGGRGLMDWPCTEGYVKATAKALNLPLRFQWKDGGFEGEMLRENSKTAGVYYEDVNGKVQFCPPSDRGKPATRRLFPQVSADLSVRWCSAYLKIDVAKRAINNDDRFKSAKILFLTGERREESTARSKYNEVEEHGCSGNKRRVDQWRCVIDWTEQDVWNIIKKHNIVPHPAYRLGWGRVSCMACIFGDRDQWASVRSIAADRFSRISAYEKEFGKTIKRDESIEEQANRGKSFVENAPDWLIKLAMTNNYPEDEVFTDDWQVPTGAYKRCGGPI